MKIQLTLEEINIYSKVYIINEKGTGMDTAKLFTNGKSQAVRLPKTYRFVGNEVFIKKTPEGVLLIPKTGSVWEVWEKNLKKYDEPFMIDRNQPEMQQNREGLDDLFD
jgi:antitoxin VapB